MPKFSLDTDIYVCMYSNQPSHFIQLMFDRNTQKKIKFVPQHGELLLGDGGRMAAEVLQPHGVPVRETHELVLLFPVIYESQTQTHFIFHYDEFTLTPVEF